MIIFSSHNFAITTTIDADNAEFSLAVRRVGRMPAGDLPLGGTAMRSSLRVNVGM